MVMLPAVKDWDNKNNYYKNNYSAAPHLTKLRPPCICKYIACRSDYGHIRHWWTITFRAIVKFLAMSQIVANKIDYARFSPIKRNLKAKHNPVILQTFLKYKTS